MENKFPDFFKSKIEHYKKCGVLENRDYCIINKAILLHVGNIDVFFKIYNNNSKFFEDNVLVFITLHKNEYIEIIRQFIPNAFFTIIENKGADIGGFLNNMKLLVNHPNYLNIDIVYIIHTKTNDHWRHYLLSPLINNYKKIEFKLMQNNNIPIIIGSDKYCYRNNGINRNYIEEIFNRNKDNFNKLINNDWHNYIDEYVFENKDFEDKQNKNIGLYVNPDFYKNYEGDLKYLSNSNAIDHFENNGINEYYRISNPCYIKKFGKESFFIAGTIFACNREYFKIFENIDFDYEYSILEEGYVINNIPRKIHSWEYLFGFLAYCRNGYINTINENGDINVMENTDKEFNLDIYRACNLDLNHFNDNDLLFHYNTYGKYENRIHSKETLLKVQAILNNDLLKATTAICINIPPNNYSDEYFHLLTKINELYNHNEALDIYFGDGVHNYNTYNGYSTINKSLPDLVKILDSYNILDIQKINFYIGFNLQRNYEKTIIY
jgi:hypothetical protein